MRWFSAKLQRGIGTPPSKKNDELSILYHIERRCANKAASVNQNATGRSMLSIVFRDKNSAGREMLSGRAERFIRIVFPHRGWRG
jgi:hypothetical protein